MGYDFYNELGHTFRLGIKNWDLILRLARDYGWKPEGVIPRQFAGIDLCENLNGIMWNYIGNDFQVVKKTDSRKIAEALEKALDDIPDFELSGSHTNDPILIHIDNFADLRNKIREAYNPKDNPLIYFSGSGKELLKSFIDYCKEGSFEIS